MKNYNNQRSIAASIISRIAAEYDLFDVRDQASKDSESLRTMNKEYKDMVSKTQSDRPAYKCMDIIDRIIDKNH